MKKKTTILAVLAIAGLALSTLLVSAFTALPLPNLLASYTQNNIDVEDLNRVNFRSNYGELDNKAGWLIDIGFDGDEHLFGTINKEDIKDKSGKEPKNSLRMDSYGYDKWLSYELVESEGVQPLDYKTVNCESYFTCKQNAKDKCRDWSDKGDYFFYRMEQFKKSEGNMKLACFRKRSAGWVYDLTTEYKKWKATLKLTAGDNTATATINDSVNRNIKMEAGGETKAFIDEVNYNVGEMAIDPGNILNFATCEGSKCSNSQVLLAKNYIEDYTNAEDNLPGCIGDIRSENDAYNCYNSYETTVPGAGTSGWHTGELDGTMKYDHEEDRMEYRGPEVSFEPSITMHVLGPDFMGIYEAVAKPRIKSLTSPKINEQESGIMVADVKNNAGVGGDFVLSGNCDPGVNIRSGTGQKKIGADSRESYQIEVQTSPINVDDKDVTCRITASSEAVTSTKETTVTIAGGDQPTREYCNNGKDDDGDGLADCKDSDCKSLPVCQNGGEKKCDDSIDNDQDGLIDCADPDCRDSEACGGPGINWMAVGLIMVLAIGGAGAYWWWRKKR